MMVLAGCGGRGVGGTLPKQQFPHFDLHAKTYFSNSRGVERSSSMFKNRWLVGILVLMFCGVYSLSALAQVTTGGLQGLVKDPSCAVVPGAKVAATCASLVGSTELS